MKLNAQACKPIITATGIINSCIPSSAVTLAVNDPTIFAFVWSTGASGSVTSVSVAGSYTVTATYSNGCVGSTTISVKETEYHVEVDQFISLCFQGSQQISITNPLPGVNYNWSIGNSSMSSILNISPSSGTSSTIDYFSSLNSTNFYIISYQYGSCDQQDTFYLMPCCNNHIPWTDHVDFENETSSNLLPADFNSIASTINLYGTIIINNSFNILDCGDIKMAAGALIKVVNGGTLRIRNSNFSGNCNTMWRGIKVEAGGSLYFFGESSLTDPEIGIELEAGSTIAIGNSAMIQNNNLITNHYIGIKVNGDINIVGIGNVTFDKVGSFLNAYPGQKLVPTDKPYAAFVLENGSLTPTVFGNQYWGGNINGIRIRNHACGFFATNYSFELQHTFFTNISKGLNYGIFNNSQNGWAVYAKAESAAAINNRSLLVQGESYPWQLLPNFDNCLGGIYTRAMSVKANACKMVCSSQGIVNRLSQSPSAMNYTQNEITVTSTNPATDGYINGIFSQFSGTTKGGIGGNFIYVTEPFSTAKQISTCIQLDDVVGADNSLLVISANTCRLLNQTDYGIKLNNISGTELENNFVYCNQTQFPQISPHYCFWSKNCVGLSFFMNHANSKTTNTYIANAIGYYNEISPRWIYSCNDAFQVGTGFQFDRDCASPENFKGNFMENNDFGLYINKPTGAMGSQGLPTPLGNQWSLASVPALIPDASVNGGANPLLSRFYVHTTASGNNFNPTFGGGLFTYVPGSTPYSCQGISIVQPPDTIAIVESEVQHADSTDEYDNGEMGDYVLNRNLYGAIDEKNALVASNTIIENYYDSMSLTAIGQLQQVANSYSNHIDKLLAITDAWQANDSIMHSNANQIQYNTNLLYTGSLSINDSNALVNANEALKLQTQALAASSNDLSNQAKWYHQNNATTALAKNNMVTTNSNYASNQKTVHQIYARTIATGNADFTPTEINALYNIAQQCLSYGGPAVLEARPMYALIDPTIHFESVPCNLGGNRWGLNDEAETKTDELLVYPNPANDIFNIYLPTETLTHVEVEIYNLTGINIKSYKFENANNTMQIVTSDLNQGLYVVKVNGNNNFYKSVKVQIIK